MLQVQGEGGLLSLSLFSHASLAVSLPFYVLTIFQQYCNSPFAFFFFFLCFHQHHPLAEFSFILSHSFSLLLIFHWLEWRASRRIKRSAVQHRSSERILSSRCVYVTEARPVKGWSPDKEKGLMIGNVARATHKHLRDVNKCVHEQRGRKVFSGLTHRKTQSLFFSPCTKTWRKHMH